MMDKNEVDRKNSLLMLIDGKISKLACMLPPRSGFTDAKIQKISENPVSREKLTEKLNQQDSVRDGIRRQPKS